MEGEVVPRRAQGTRESGIIKLYIVLGCAFLESEGLSRTSDPESLKIAPD